jgi:solute carrier family 45 protein 1/2/4
METLLIDDKNVDSTTTATLSSKRQGSILRLILLVSAVSATEFCYAAEVVFVTPLLLEVGLPGRYATIMWTMSPLLGLILQTPVGHTSDNCRCTWGRRRPFILAFACVSVLGLILVPNGKILGEKLGDETSHRPWGIALTVLGLVLMDTSLDSMLSPLRAVMLDNTNIKYHNLGNNLFALSGGVGAVLGFAISGIKWTEWLWHSSPLTDEQITYLLTLLYLIASLILSFCSIKEKRYDGQNNQSENIVIRYLKSMRNMPSDLRLLTLYCCFGFLAFCGCYIFFTDFVGQAVYSGDPSAPEGSEKLALYQKGVHMGSWGLAVFGISSAIGSGVLNQLTKMLGDRLVFVLLNVIYFVGCGVMILTQNINVVLPMAAVFGAMYVSLFSISFNLVSCYHERYQVC